MGLEFTFWNFMYNEINTKQITNNNLKNKRKYQLEFMESTKKTPKRKLIY